MVVSCYNYIHYNRISSYCALRYFEITKFIIIVGFEKGKGDIQELKLLIIRNFNCCTVNFLTLHIYFILMKADDALTDKICRGKAVIMMSLFAEILFKNKFFSFF